MKNKNDKNTFHKKSNLSSVIKNGINWTYNSFSSILDLIIIIFIVFLEEMFYRGFSGIDKWSKKKGN